MPLINTSVPNLIQGVSQQPDATRFDGQCEEQVNALSSVAEGLKKRPNTRHIGKLLDTAIGADSFVHFINRSSSEKYVVIHDGYCLKAWNMGTGNEASINGSTGGYTPAAATAATDSEPATPEGYLKTVSPSNVLKGLTVADTTFLLNTQKSVALNTAHTDALEKEALVLINQGDYKKRYQVNININPSEGTTTYEEATATVLLERYVYETTTQRPSSSGIRWSRSFNIGSYTRVTTHYRWRITGVTLNGAGAGYLNARVSFSSNRATYANANYTAVLNGTDGSITAVNLGGSRGDYEGTGTNSPDDSGSSRTTHIGPNAPAISVSIVPTSSLGSGQSLALSAYIWSGDSASGNNHKANTDNIAYWLTSDGNGSGYDPQSAGKAMNEGTNSIADYFSISRTGSLIKLTKNSAWSGDFSISTTDSLGDTAMTAIYKEVSSITDLPAKCYNGFKCKVIGDTELSQDDYYVQFQTNDGGNVGTEIGRAHV
jgi:hypothetical protein